MQHFYLFSVPQWTSRAVLSVVALGFLSGVLDVSPAAEPEAAGSGLTEPADAAGEAVAEPAQQADRPAGAATTSSPSAGQTADAEESEPNETVVDRENIKLRFNFRYQPWEDVLDWLAEQADLSLQSTLIPEGTFNYTDTRAYTPAEAIDVINGVLLHQGYTLVRRGRLLTVMDLEEEVPDVLIEFVPVEELDERGEFELVKTVFYLARMEPAEAEAEIGQLLGPGRSMVVMPKARQVMVTETAGKLRTIRDVIDRAENGAGKSETLTEITLEHITPEELLIPARALLGLGEGENVGDDVSIAQDTSGTRLFANGTRAKIELLTSLVERMDREKDSLPTAVALEQPQLLTHPIRTADAPEALAVLQTLLAGLPDVRLSLDANTNKIIALARPSEHRTIEATIKQLEGEAPHIDVIQLEKIDPQMAVLAINSFFRSDTEEGDSEIKLDADPTTMRLYVRATQSKIAEIKTLIDQLERPGPGASNGDTVRFIPLNNGTARSALETARRLWLGPNKIELLTPAESGPSVFDLKKAHPDSRAEKPAPPQLVPSTGAKQRNEIHTPPARQDKVTIQPSSKPTHGVHVQFVGLHADEEQSEKQTTQESETTEPLQPATQQSGAAAGTAKAAENDGTVSGSSPDKNGPHSPPPQSPDSVEDPEIRVELTPEGVLITSEDTEALDKFETLLRHVTGPQSITSDKKFTVYFLKYCKAEIARQLISDILGGSTSSLGGSSLLSEAASDLLGSGGGLLGAILGSGGNSSEGESGEVTTVQATGSVSIVADARLNCLVVQALPTDLELIEQLLKVIDRESSITDIETAGTAHIIPILYLNAQDVANVVKEAYADRIAQAGNQRGGGGRPNPEELIRALRGGRGGQSTRDVASEAPKMNVTVDVASNSLIVTAPGPLFREVQQLVHQIDQASSELTEDVVVVSLDNANPQAVQQALASIMGASSSRSTSRTSSASRSGSAPRDTSTGQPSYGDIRARIEAFRRMQSAFGGEGRGSRFGGRGSSPSGRSAGDAAAPRDSSPPSRRGGGRTGRSSGRR